MIDQLPFKCTHEWKLLSRSLRVCRRCGRVKLKTRKQHPTQKSLEEIAP